MCLHEVLSRSALLSVHTIEYTRGRASFRGLTYRGLSLVRPVCILRGAQSSDVRYRHIVESGQIGDHCGWTRSSSPLKTRPFSLPPRKKFAKIVHFTPAFRSSTLRMFSILAMLPGKITSGYTQHTRGIIKIYQFLKNFYYDLKNLLPHLKLTTFNKNLLLHPHVITIYMNNTYQR